MKNFTKFIQLFIALNLLPLSMLADIQVGYGTNTLFLPVNPSWGYSYSQVIYYKSEIMTAGNITTLSWYFNGTSLSNSNDWTIYLGHTSKTAFTGGTDWVPVGSMTQVWSGIFTSPTGPGWITIDITDFAYNNVDNLVVAVDENKPSWNGNSDRFYCTAVSSNRAILYYNDGNNPNPASPPNGSTQSNISDIILGGLTLSNPPACATLISPVDAGINILTTATLNWSNGGSIPVTGYKLFFGTDNPPTNIANGTNLGAVTSYNPTPVLINNTAYYWKIVPFNSAGNASGCPVWSFSIGGIGIQIGDGILTTKPLPLGPNNNYTYSQVIYLQSEINCTGVISSLSWYYNNQGLYGSRDWNIYIGHTSKTYFSGTNDWIPVSSMTQVWSGTIPDNSAAGWYTVDITDFSYNNTDNLVVAVDENDPNVSGQNSFYCMATATNRAIYSSGTSNPNPTSPPAGTTTNHIADIILGGLPSTALPGGAAHLTPVNGEINTTATPILRWISGQGTPPAGYKIYFGTDNPPTNIANGVNLGLQTYYNPSPALLNLTNYYWKIVPYNANGDAINCPVWSFRTVIAGKQIGYGSDLTQPLPIDASVLYSYSQEIYLKSDINIAGTIDELWWYFSGTSLSNSNNWTIYLGHTSKTSFSSNSDWIPVSGLTQVWNGTFPNPTVQGWLKININDFAYNNVDNLVIAVDENGASYNSGTDRFRCSFGGANRSIYCVNSSNINPASPPAGTRTQYYAIIFIGGLGSVSPPLPANAVSPENGASNVFNSISLNWSSGGGIPTGYKIYLGTDNPPTNLLYDVDLGNVLTYNPSPDLDFMTTYYWKIVPYNSYGVANACPIWTFTTGPDHRITVFPHIESFTATNFPYYGWATQNTGGTPNGGNWVRATTGSFNGVYPYTSPAMIAYNGYYSYGTSGILITAPVIFPADNYQVDFWMYRDYGSLYPDQPDIVNIFCNTNPNTVGAVLLGSIHRLSTFSPVSSPGWFEYSFNMPEGVAGTEQYFIFEAIFSGPGNILIDDLAFQAIPVCQTPIDQTVTDVTSSSALLGWTETGTATNWDLEIVEAGSDPTGIPTIESVSTNPFTCQGLISGKQYAWYVRADCENLLSEWAGPSGFTTVFSVPYLQDFDFYTLDEWSEAREKPPTGTASDWFQYSGNARLDIIGNNCREWMFSPSIDLGTTDCTLEFDIALQDYNNPGQAPLSVGSDDKFEVHISTDGGLTYNPLKIWNNSTSPKFGEIPVTFEHISIDLSAYSGLIKLGFYGESWLTNAQNYLLLDNFLINYPGSLPGCAELIWPSNGVVNLPINVYMFWLNGAASSGCKLFFGTDNPPSNILNGIDLGNVSNYDYSGMDYATTYYWRVETYNDNGVSTGCSVSSFQTFVPLTSLPYCDDFNDQPATGSLPVGWSQISDNNSYAYLTSMCYSSSPYGIYVNNYSQTDDLYLISPPFNESVSLSNQQIRCKIRGYDYNSANIIIAGTMTDPGDVSTFTAYDTVNLNNQAIEEEVFYLFETNASDHYFAFKKEYGSCCLDDLCIEDQPPCIPISALSVSDVTESSAMLGWSGHGNPTTWDIEYGLTGFVKGTGTLITGVPNPYLLIGLDANIAYDFYVRADCGTSQSIWTGPMSFTTLCTSYSLPLGENFDSGPELPDCWNSFISGSNGYGNIVVTNLYSHSQPNSCQLYTSNNNNEDRITMLVSPKIEGGLNGKMVTFFGLDAFEPTNLLPNSIVVGTIGIPGNMQSFSPIETIELTNTFDEYTVCFGDQPGNDEHIAFKQINNGNYYINFFIDDISIVTAPSCIPPVNLIASALTYHSAELSWDEIGNATLWNIEYGEEGFIQGTGTVVNGVSNPHIFEGLNSSQNYDFYIQSVCGDEHSAWKGPGYFTTECSPASVPWSENFDGVTYPSIPECIKLQTSATNVPWRIYEWYANSSPNSFALYGLYDYYATPIPNDDWFFSAPLALTGGVTYSVSFYYIDGYSEFSFHYSKMEVKWGTGPSSQEMTYGPIFYNNDINLPALTQAISYFTPETSGTYYIGWHGFGLGRAVLVDDIVVDIGPDCPPPCQLTANNAVPESAQLSWLETGNATSWNIEYGETGFLQGTGTLISSVSNPYELTGLIAAQSYDFYIQADCGTTQSQWSEPKTFVTPCEVAVIPFIEHFDYTEFPPCWSQSTSESIVPDRWIIASDYSLGSPNPLMRSLIYVNGNGTARLISPPIDLTGITPRLEFIHSLYNYSTPDLILKVQTSSDGINWTDEDWSINPGMNDIDNDTVKVTLNHNLGSHTFIAWVFEGPFGNGAYWYLDDVYVDIASIHPRPTGLDAINIGFTSADLIWTSYSGLSEIEWMPVDFSAGSGTKVMGITSPFSLGDLTESTSYKFYIRDDWGGGDYSPWADPFAFTTLAPCPEGTITEGEPCGSGLNDYCENATPVANGITICGTTWFDGFERDIDMFILELPLGYQKITVEVNSEAELILGFETQNTPGVSGCENLSYWLYPNVWIPANGTGTLEVFIENPGTYYFRLLQPSAGFDDCPGSDYTATFTIEKLDPPTAEISPESFTANLYPNGATQDNLVISNLGDFPFEYHAKIIPTNTVLCYPQSANYWTGSCTQTEKTQASMISRSDPEVGWAKFDVSAIPWDAKITGVKFHGYLTDYNGPWWFLTPLPGLDPVFADPADIYDSVTYHAGGWYPYSYNGDTVLPTGYLSRTLGASAVSDLQAALFNGWFALGLANSNYSHYTQFEGWAEAHPPFLEISYIPNGWINLRDSVYISGTVPPNSIVNVPVNFNAGGMPVGQYSTEIHLNTNIDGDLILPVTMNVDECISCPPGSVQENEFYGEDVNGGCNMPFGTETFSQVENGVTICGNTWCDGYTRDTDWFELVLTEGWNRITVETSAGTNLDVGMVDQFEQGIAGCDNITGNLSPWVEVPACGTITLEVFLENPGTYYFFIAQSIWNISYLGTPYYATWMVETLTPPVAVINPDSLIKNLAENGYDEDILKIENNGTFPLKYQAEVSYVDSAAGTGNYYPQSYDYWTGSCDYSSKFQHSLIVGVGYTTGWAKFDISGIPANATITNVKFHGYVEDNAWPYWSITPLGAIDPVTVGAQEINDFISSNYFDFTAYSYNEELDDLPLGWLSRTLGNGAVSDLQAALVNGWFALGVVDFDFSYYYGIVFQGWAEANPPWLEISYAVNPVNWLTIDGGNLITDTLSGNSFNEIPAEFNASGITLGTYHANILISTNESGHPVYDLPVTMNVGYLQILNIPAGWSGVSSYVDPLSKSVEDIFAPYSSDFIILTSMTQFYYPETGVNTIGNWNFETGYKIKAANEFEVTMAGTKVNDPVLSLSEGWNLIPVLSPCEVSVAEIFRGYENLIIVTQVAGPLLYWPAYNINTLQSLLPGKAYFVATSDAGSVAYPECTKSTFTQWQDEKPENYTPWTDLHYTTSSHVIAFPTDVLVTGQIQPGDYIGLFNPEGRCAGFVEITDLSANKALTCFADDQTTNEKEGFDPGEMMQFRLYRPHNNKEIEMEVAFDPALPNMGLFENHGLSAVKSIILNPEKAEEPNKINCEVYPNPSHGNFTMIRNSWPEKLQIQVMDIQGQVIKVFEPGKKLSGSTFELDLTGLPKGIYFLKLTDTWLLEIKKIVMD